jgi:hypothetical protein
MCRGTALCATNRVILPNVACAGSAGFTERPSVSGLCLDGGGETVQIVSFSFALLAQRLVKMLRHSQQQGAFSGGHGVSPYASVLLSHTGSPIVLLAIQLGEGS